MLLLKQLMEKTKMLCVGEKTRPFGHPVTENAFIVLISKQDTVNQIKTDQAFSPRLLSSLNTLTNMANTSWNPSWSMRLNICWSTELKQACIWATESLAYSGAQVELEYGCYHEPGVNDLRLCWYMALTLVLGGTTTGGLLLKGFG